MEHLTMIGELLGAILLGMAGFLLSKLKTYIEAKKPWGVSKKDLEFNAKVRDLLVEARSRFRADRASIAQFKNGSYYSTGQSEQKFVTSHIICRSGVELPKSLNTEISISHIVGFLEDIIEKKQTILFVRQLDDSNYFKALSIQSGTESFAAHALFNSKHKLIGVLFLAWLDSSDMPLPDFLALENQAIQISAFLQK